MSFDGWLAFAAASAVLLAIPGPTVLLIVSYALGHGRKATAGTVAGVALGDFTSMTASLLGLGALLATSAAIFTLLKWIGAAYLIYMGVRLWRAPVGETGVEPAPEKTSRRIFFHAYAVTALNPKSIVFFVAFLPQFLDATRPLPAQMAIFEISFLVLAIANSVAYAFMAAAARQRIRQARVRRAVNRAGGSLLVGAGLLAAAWRHAHS